MACGCKKKGCHKCCGNVSPATPLQPFCGPAVSCREDHCQEIINQQFAAALKIQNSWNVPACGGAATLYISGLVAVSVGSYLWNSQYGYFEVVGFDKDTHQVTVENPCIDGNAPEGTQVPACTYFIVTDAPIEAGGGGSPGIFPFVAIDFTAPNDGDCLLITVTNVNGLVVGKNVQIGSGTYRVSSIPDGTHITICNDGFGITPGTAVIAKNAANQFQYPIILIDANPCTNDPIASGCLVACKDDIISPLGIPADLQEGMVPVIMADGACDVEWRLLEVPTKTCTTITCCLTLVPGEDTYTINVADSSQFTVGDVLQIGTRTDRFTVTDIPDGTHITGTMDPIPGVLVDIEPGTSICIVDCCELIEIMIEELLPDPTAFMGSDDAENADPVTLNSGAPTYTGDEASVVVTNPSSVRSFRGFAFANSVLINAEGNNCNTDMLVFEHILHLSNASPPVAIVGGDQTYFFKDDDPNPIRSCVSWMHGFTLAPSASITWFAKGSLSWAEAGASELLVPAAGLNIELVVFGVAI